MSEAAILEFSDSNIDRLSDGGFTRREVLTAPNADNQKVRKGGSLLLPKAAA